MEELYSPRQVARAMQVSESSVKRWCDRGAISSQHTAGGHRRIALGALMDFIRSGAGALLHPEVLGLPVGTGKTSRALDRAVEPMLAALLEGQEESCRRIALELYLAGHSMSSICDQVFTTAFQAIGERWLRGESAIFEERRGCEVALRALHSLRSVLASVAPEAPLALGGSLSGDPYTIAPSMIELVLQEAGYRAVLLGGNLPLATLAEAAQRLHPAIVWISCGHLPEPEEFLRDYARLEEELRGEVAIVVGGRALSSELRSQMIFSAHCDRLSHLEAFARTLLRSRARPGRRKAPRGRRGPSSQA